MNLLIQLKRMTPVFFVALTWFVLSPAAQALLPPTPDADSNGSEANVQSLLRVASGGDTITLPSGTFTSSSIASRYPGDKKIASDPAVIFADDFESYTSVDQIKTKWGNGSWLTRMRIATEPANVFSGHKSVEFTVPISLTEIGCSLWKILNPEQDTVYMRMYHKFDSGFNITGVS
jgi:hypothetical protein